MLKKAMSRAWRKAGPYPILHLHILSRNLSRSSSPPAAGVPRFVALWGNGDYGRLGLGDLNSQWRPAVNPFFLDEEDLITAVACGGAHTLFLTEKGRIYATGLNDFGQLGVTFGSTHLLKPHILSSITEKIVQVCAGYHHSAAVSDKGELFMWGSNSSGQLGLGRKFGSFVSTPTKLDSLAGVRIKTVALGSEHSIAVSDNGSVLSWGKGTLGRLGHGGRQGMMGFLGSSSEYTPRLIKNFEELKIRKIAAGLMHSACIDEQGSVFIFGEKTAGNLGLRQSKSTLQPSPIHDLPLSEEVACGGYHTCIVTRDGQLFTWGSNENGCLGLGFTNEVGSPCIVESTFMKLPITSISCGWKHTAAVSGGNLLTWGWGGASGTFFEDGLSSGGQLGHGNDMDMSEPMIVGVDSNIRPVQVSCGFNHTAAIFECI